MDFSWTAYFGGFFSFVLLCLLFMGVMMLACHGKAGRGGCCQRGAPPGKADDEVSRPARLP